MYNMYTYIYMYVCVFMYIHETETATATATDTERREGHLGGGDALLLDGGRVLAVACDTRESTRGSGRERARERLRFELGSPSLTLYSHSCM
jgi:hypothetical protein